jgi:hypothetical protein
MSHEIRRVGQALAGLTGRWPAERPIVREQMLPIGVAALEGTMPRTDYVLGSTPRELERLITQSQILRPITERLMRQVGLSQGMRVPGSWLRDWRRLVSCG